MKYDLQKSLSANEDWQGLIRQISAIQEAVGKLHASIREAEAELSAVEKEADDLAVSVELGEGDADAFAALERRAAELRENVRERKQEVSRKSRALEVLNGRLDALQKSVQEDLRVRLQNDYAGAVESLAQTLVSLRDQNESVLGMESNFRHIGLRPPHESMKIEQFSKERSHLEIWLAQAHQRGYYDEAE